MTIPSKNLMNFQTSFYNGYVGSLKQLVLNVKFIQFIHMLKLFSHE